MVGYAGITTKAGEATLISDLSNIKKQLTIYYVEYGTYPTTMVANCPAAPYSDTKYCLKSSAGVGLAFNSGNNGSTYTVVAKKPPLAYSVTYNRPPTLTVNIGAGADWLVIGSQTWAKANLNVGTMIAGSTSPTNDSVIEKYCYGNIEANCTTYGGLYNWNEAMNYVVNDGAQGICPAGSRIPSDDDWKLLELNLGMTQLDGMGLILVIG